ncbi:hypothetical protein ES708_06682 [subsurface metagenome]
MIKKIVKLLIKRTSYYNKLLNYNKLEEYWKWLYSGKPIPPPDIVKQMIVKEYANRYHVKIMVETGTYEGAMINAVKDVFDKIYSIELSNELYLNASKKFEKCGHIKVYNGDSSEIMPKVIGNINEACLFWLDGHYMESVGIKAEKKTPIIEEIKHIANHSVKNHILLVDDARYFTGHDNYPALKQFCNIINEKFSNHSFIVENDIIRITPKQSLY